MHGSGTRSEFQDRLDSQQYYMGLGFSSALHPLNFSVPVFQAHKVQAYALDPKEGWYMLRQSSEARV